MEAGRIRVRLGRVTKRGSVVTVESEDGRPVVVESGDIQAGGLRIQAQRVRIDLDPQARTLQASGAVRLERSRRVTRRTYAFDRSVRRDGTRRITVPGSELGPNLAPRASPAFSGSIGSGEGSVGRTKRGLLIEEFFTEVLVGNDLSFDARAQRGALDGAQMQLGDFDFSASSISLEGDGYQARDVVLRPSGLSEREKEIYGIPPFSLRAPQVGVIFENGQASEGRSARLVVRRAGLYYRNTRLLPIPQRLLAPLSRVRLGASRASGAAPGARGAVSGTSGMASSAPSLLRIVPKVSVNSIDRILLGARISFGLGGLGRSSTAESAERQDAANASGVADDMGAARSGGRTLAARAARGGSVSVVNLDLGLSGRLGFRGGVSLESRSALGLLSLQARRSDIVRTQLTNRLEIDRSPELSFDSALLPILGLGDGHGLGAFVSASGGRFSEREIRSGRARVESSRLSGTVGLSTRLDERDGLYADLFATRTRYGLSDSTYSNTGFEIGYLGQVLPQVRGLFLLRHVSLGGSTPFRFDEVEIPRELRATFDIAPTPRFLIPIDLRYDLDTQTLRDRSVGVLRNYKTFAYGVVYQAARHDLRLELRSNF